jgi:hypothetical protein
MNQTLCATWGVFVHYTYTHTVVHYLKQQIKGAAESGGDSAYIGRLVNVSLPIMVRTCMH